MNKLSEMLNYVQSHAGLSLEFKTILEAFITNKEIPLETRWGLWVKSPVEMKNVDRWCHEFECLPGYFFEDDQPYHLEKHETVECSLLVEMLMEDLAEHVVDIVALKEEILTKNLHSFTWDW